MPEGAMRPSVGRIVHVHSPGQTPPCRAGIVTAVWEGGTIDVTVFPPVGGAPYGETDLTERALTDDDPPEGRHVATWHWPERV